MRHLCFYLFVLFSTGWRKRVLRNLFVSWSLVFNFVSHPKKSQRKRDRVYPGWKNRNRLPVFFLVLVVDNEHLRQPVETAFIVSGGSDFRGDFFRLILSDLSLTGKRKIPKTRFLISRIRVDFSTKKFKPKGQPSRVGGGFDTAWSLCCVLCPLPPVFGNQTVDRF